MIRMICAHAARGGTGKTQLVANLAVRLAGQGRRVGIIDADLYAPGLHLLFNLGLARADRTLNEYLRGEASLEEAVYPVGGGFQTDTGARIALPGEVYLIPARHSVDAIEGVWREGYDLDLLHQAFRQLIANRRLDFLLVDTHPGLNEQYELLTVAAADLLLIVTRPDAQHLATTRLLAHALHKLEEPPTWIVVNQLAGRPGTTELSQNITEALGLDMTARLPLSLALLQMGSQGIFVQQHPDDPWSVGVSQLADRILAMSV